MSVSVAISVPQRLCGTALAALAAGDSWAHSEPWGGIVGSGCCCVGVVETLGFGSACPCGQWRLQVHDP